MKTSASLHYLTQEPWDLFLTVFKEAHCSGHHFWHLSDPSHPAYEQGLAREVGDVMKDVYVRIDSAVGELTRVAGPETNVIVFTPLGMMPNHPGAQLMPEIVKRINAFAGSHVRFAETVAHRALQKVVMPIRRTTRRLWRFSDYLEQSVPLRSAVCFALPHSEAVSALRFNVAGRDPNGWIEPGEPLRLLSEKVAEELTSLIDADTGARAVHEVVKCEAVSSMGGANAFPDLLILWNVRPSVTRVSSLNLGLIETKRHIYRSGNHRAGGLLFGGGPSVARCQAVGQADVTDVAPTVCRMLGVDLTQASGRPIQDLIVSQPAPAFAS